MDSQKRLMLALVLSFGLTSVYVMYGPKAPAPEATAIADAGALAPGAVVAQPTMTTAAGLDSKPPVDLPPVALMDKHRGQLDLGLSNEGGSLTRAQLLGPKMREQVKISLKEGFERLAGKQIADGPPTDMALPVPGEALPLSVSVVGSKNLLPSARYRVEEAVDGKSTTFIAQEGPLEVTKRYDWSTEDWEFALSIQVKNLGTEPVTGELEIHDSRGVVAGAEEKGSFFGGVGNESSAVCDVADDVHKKVSDGKPVVDAKGPVTFFGISQQYFLSAVFPLDGPKEGRCVLNGTPTSRVANVFFPLALAPGQSATHKFGVFIGPKDVEVLRKVGEALKPYGFAPPASGGEGWRTRLANSTFPHLEKTVDFGIWAAICKVLLGILKFFYSVVHNWGVAIILLTVMVKLVLLPLTHKSMVSAEQMKKLQPKMEEIKKKFASDRERQNVETMKLYQENKVNPLGGCLPMLLQMPVWIALFTTLRNSYELYREPFISPIWADLTYKDPTYLLPLALGITMFITQRLQPQMMDAAQARLMLYIMPVFFTALMMNYPAGLSLYIFTNNLLSIAQQYGLRRYLEKKGVAAPRPPVEKKPRRPENERTATRKRSDP